MSQVAFVADTLSVIFYLSEIVTIFVTKKCVYRIFIFGLALAELHGFLYAGMARSLYDFTP